MSFNCAMNGLEYSLECSACIVPAPFRLVAPADGRPAFCFLRSQSVLTAYAGGR